MREIATEAHHTTGHIAESTCENPTNLPLDARGEREMEGPLEAWKRLSVWAVMIGFCVLFWFAVYTLVVAYRAA